MPNQWCSLCPNEYPQFTLHKFPPARNHDIFLRWLEIMPEEIKKINPAILRQKYMVCESHFNRDDYFAISGKRRLKRNSIPKLEAMDQATPRMKRTSSSMGCTPKAVAMYKNLDILSTAERNIDESPEIEVVTLGLHEIEVVTLGPHAIPGNSSDNISVINDIPVPSTDNIQAAAASETENTPKQDRNRSGQKRTINTTRAVKKRRLDMTDGSTVSSDALNKNDAPPSIDTNCHTTLSSEIPKEKDITFLPTRPTSEIAMQSATAVSPASIVHVANADNMHNSAVNVDQNNPCSVSICTTQSSNQNKYNPEKRLRLSRKRPKSVVNQLAQIVSNNNKENVSTSTATLRQRNRGCYRRRRRYQSKYARLRKNIKKNLKEGVQQFCFSKLNDPTREFVEMQIENQEKKQKGRRWMLRYKAMAALWLKWGPRSFNVLRRLRFALPSKKMIMRQLSDIAFEPGINEGVMQSLKEAVSLMKDLEKLCYITFDEMSCHEALHYDIKQDIIVGFQDLGGGRREPAFANHVMVVMVRGIARAWKQAIAYYFTNIGMDSINIEVMVKDVITKLHEIGLCVLATVCNASSSNINAVKNLLEETRVAFIRKGEENKHFGFLIEDKEVIPLFDPPHLLKDFRNNLFKKNIVFKLNNKWYEASWSDIVTLYERDCTDAVTRNCRKLTEYHIDPEKGGKMEVKYAAQVFSRVVFCCFRNFLHNGVFANKERAEGTAQLVWFFDQLFDSVNGNKKKVEKDQFLYCVVNQGSKHLDFWNKAIQTLSSMEFKATGRYKKKPPCLAQWIQTVKGFMYLWEILRDKYNFQFLISRNINQDGLENFFHFIRSNDGQNVNPTTYKFISLFKTMLISSCTSIKAPRSNCKREKYDEVLSPILSLIQNLKKLEKDKQSKKEEDDDILITHLEFLNNLNFEVSDPDEDFDDITVELSDMANCYKALFVYKIRKSTRFYFAGYMVKRAAKCIRHCNQCKMELFTEEVIEFAEWVLTRQRGEIRKLKLPDTEFFTLFTKMYDVAKMVVPQISYRLRVRSILKYIIRKTLQEKFSFSCTKHNLFEIVLNLFATFYIRIWILNVNRILYNKDLRQIDDEIKMMALEVLQKRTSRVRKIGRMKNQSTSRSNRR